METLIFVYLSAIFLFSGLAISLGDRLGFYLVLMLPLFLYFQKIKENERIKIPSDLVIAWLGFSFFTLISVFLSHDKQLSIEAFLLYQASFITGIYFFNNKTRLGKVLNRSIIFSGVIFALAFLFKDQLLKYTNIFDSNQIFNFFFPAVNKNNHLGIWMGMAAIIAYAEYGYGWIIMFAPFILLSYSRSAYLGLLGIILHIANIKLRLSGWAKLTGFMLLTGTVVLAIVIFVPRASILSDRAEYYKEAILGFYDKPLFGYGIGNFTEISRRYASVSKGVFGTTSHNILLDILSGSGIFASIFFVLFLVTCFKNRKENRYFWSAAFLFICFNLSYVFAMPVLILLFFIFIGLSYKEKKAAAFHFPFIVTALFLAAIGGCIGYSEYLYLNGYYSQSITAYPYRKDAYEMQVTQFPSNNKAEIIKTIDKYKNNFPQLFEPYNFSGYTYELMGEYDYALSDYLFIYENGTGFNPAIAKQIQTLYLKKGQPIKAYEISKLFIRTILGDPKKYPQMVNGAYDFCINTNIIFLDKAVCF